MLESLLYLEFNILYDNYDSTPNWTNITKHKDGSYTAEYTGSSNLNISMIVHNLSWDGKILTMKKMSLSDLYLRYEYMNESMEIMEDLSIEYYRFIFHSVTKNYYLKRYMRNSDLTSLFEFIDRKSESYSEATRRLLIDLIGNDDESDQQGG